MTNRYLQQGNTKYLDCEPGYTNYGYQPTANSPSPYAHSAIASHGELAVLGIQAAEVKDANDCVLPVIVVTDGQLPGYDTKSLEAEKRDDDDEDDMNEKNSQREATIAAKDPAGDPWAVLDEASAFTPWAGKITF